MNKLIIPLLLVFLIVTGFVAKERMRTVPNESFGKGEILKYKVHYGYINAAEGIIDIADDLHRINGRPCYKVNVSGKTIGSFDYFLKIRDTWRSYIDTTSIVPQRFFRNIEEGKYRKKETMDFDHHANLVRVEDKRKQKHEYKVPDNVQDIVSGFYYLRTIDLNQYKKGDVINIQGFFDEEIFDFSVVYHGKELVDTKAGKFRAFKLIPKMPENKLFSGENAVTVYLSDDKNKIPVLIKAEMFVGSLKVDLYKYENLKNPVSLVKK